MTPSIGLVEELCSRFKSTVEIHCLIRPRPGDFVYSDNEMEVILRDILRFKTSGVHGIVVGILLPNGLIDSRRMKMIRDISEGMSLTFHRAYDVCSEIDEQKVDALRCDRILTSGRSSSAFDGRENIKNMVARLKSQNSKLKVIAAAGISSKNVKEIIITSAPHVSQITSESFASYLFLMNFDFLKGIHAGSSVCEKLLVTLSGNKSEDGINLKATSIVHMGNKVFSYQLLKKSS